MSVILQVLQRAVILDCLARKVLLPGFTNRKGDTNIAEGKHKVLNYYTLGGRKI